MIIPIKLCPITEIAFFLLTSPPCASPAAGVWSMTNVVAQSIQATSPELNVGCDSQQIRPTPSTNGPSHSNVAFQDEWLRVFLQYTGWREGLWISPKRTTRKDKDETITRFHGSYSAQVAPFARAADERKEKVEAWYGLLPSMFYLIIYNSYGLVLQVVTVDLLGGMFDHPLETRTINQGNGTFEPRISAHSFMCNRATILEGGRGEEVVFVFWRGVPVVETYHCNPIATRSNATVACKT